MNCSFLCSKNCGILLSKLKMTDEEITKAMLSMDEKDELSKDMVEQVKHSTLAAIYSFKHCFMVSCVLIILHASIAQAMLV